MARLADLTPPPKPRFVDDADARPAPLEAHSIVELLERDVPVLPMWIGPAVLPKSGKMLLGGEAKIGKSFLCMELCRALATGGRLFHADTLPVPGPAKVLYVEQEIGEPGIRARAAAMLADEPDLELVRQNWHYTSKSSDLFMDTLAGLGVLAELLDRIQPNVLVLDPASRLLKGDDSDNTVVRAFFRNIDKLIKEYQALDLSVVVAHHFRKPPQPHTALALDDEERYSPYNFRGGSDFFNAPDTILTCIRPPEPPGRSDWILGCKYTTRHGEPGPINYLKIAPRCALTVTQTTHAEAQQRAAEAEAAREAARPRKRKAAKQQDEEWNFGR